MSPAPSISVHPSTKLLLFYYIAGAAFYAAAAYFYVGTKQPGIALALFVAGDVIVLSALVKYISRRFIVLTLDQDRLRYEEGMISKTTRTFNLEKIQDVRVEQGIFERMVGVGTIIFENAGETGRLTMASIDQPQAIADAILARARSTRRN